MRSGIFRTLLVTGKIYGNCPHNDIGAGTIETNVEDCRKRCEAEPTCVAFAFKNIQIFNILGGSAGGTNCYLKSMCDDDNLSHNNPGVYIYFKGLMKEGKVFFISYGYIIGSHHIVSTFLGTHKLAMLLSFNLILLNN